MVGEFNFISSLDEKDKDLFFGPLENECFLKIDEKDIMAHLLFKTGIFGSIGEARKNGWNIPIPFGFTDIRVGKKKTRITILNIDKRF